MGLVHLLLVTVKTAQRKSDGEPQVPALSDLQLKNLKAHNFSASLFSLLNNCSDPSKSMLLKGCKGQNMSSQRKNSKKNINQTSPNPKVLLSLSGKVLNLNSKIMK